MGLEINGLFIKVMNIGTIVIKLLIINNYESLCKYIRQKFGFTNFNRMQAFHCITTNFIE